MVHRINTREVVVVNRLCKTHRVSYGLLIGIILISTFLPAAQAFVPQPIPTPISKIFYYRYHVTQNVVDYNKQTQTSEFDEIYRIEFFDSQKVNFTSVLDYTFYLSCGASSTKNWYFESTVDYGSRLINDTLIYQDNMNYENTHIRLYAPGGTSSGSIISSNNIEVGYRWGIKPALHDITMTRTSDILYNIGLNTFDAMNFYGYEERLNIFSG